MAEASLQTVMHRGLDRYRGTHRLSPRQWQVCHHILDCRTEALGGLGLDCDHCGQRVPHYYACRDRHCPRCQRRASQALRAATGGRAAGHLPSSGSHPAA